MPRRFPAKPLVISLAIVLALVVVYALLGFFAAPVLIQRAVAQYAAESLERKASVGKVRVNPFLLRLELNDFALTESDGRPILAFGRLFLDLEVSSAARRAWTLSEIALEKPDLRVDIGPDGRVNLVLLLEKIAGKERAADDKLPRMLLRRVALRAGSITLSDRSGPTPATTAVEPANLELRDISTLPDERGEYSVSARLVDGGSCAWRGDVSLATLSSRGEVSVTGVKPVTAWRFLRGGLAVAEPRGELDLNARYSFAFAAGKPQLALEDVRLNGRGIELTQEEGKQPMLAVGSISASGGSFDLAARRFLVSSLEIRDGAIGVEVDRERALNWEKLVKPREKSPGGEGRGAKSAADEAQGPRGAEAALPADSGSAAGPQPWSGRIESLQVAGMRLNFADRSRAKPIEIEAVELALSLAANVEVRPQAGIQVALEGAALQLTRASLRESSAPEPVAAFDAIVVEGARLDLDAREVALGRVGVKGGAVKVTRDRNGAVPLIELLTVTDPGLVAREVEDAVKKARAEGRPWRFAMDALEIAGTRVAVSDQSFGDALVYDGEDVRARLTGFHSDGKNPVRIEASMRFAQGGSVAASGALRLSGEEFNGSVRLEGLSLKPLQPVLFLRAKNAVLASGDLSGDIKAEYRARGGKQSLRATGRARIDNVRIDEAATGERVLGWTSLAANGINLNLAPTDLKVEEARITGLTSKLIIYKDRTVNLMKILAVEPGPAAGAAASSAAPETIADLEARFPITIGRVVLDKGVVDFADLSLVLPFAAKVQDLEGVVQGMSSDRASRATVRLEGRVDEYGLARASGSLRPFQPTSFLDLTVVFRNVEMPPLSAYSATFAGRRIASGRLSLDLQYKIDNGMLAGENRVVLEKFTLGERVEAPGALNLPLDLAVAVLTDSDGKIDLAVPVRGNVNDPQFSYGQVIWQAISNVLTRIVTAPFRALASLFGGSAEQAEQIVFDPGRAALLPPEREKLKRLAEALAKRPQLRLVAEGQYGPADRAALQRANVELTLAAALGRAPAADKAPDPVDVMDAKTQRALEALFVERHSAEALSQFAAETGKSRGKPVDRVNAALALIGRGSADREFYEALLKRLYDTAPVPPTALAQLAGERASAVVTHLATVLAVPPARAEARTAKEAGAAQVKFILDAVRLPGTRD